MRTAITLALSALVFTTGCQRSPEIVKASNGEVYFITGGQLYRVHGDTMTAVLSPPTAAENQGEKYARRVRKFDGAIPAMGVLYQLKLKAFGPTDVRYILTVGTLNDSAVFSGPRSCWRAWTQSVPYLTVELQDSDGFSLGHVALDATTERVNEYNPEGASESFDVYGSSPALTEATLADVARSSPAWHSCSRR